MMRFYPPSHFEGRTLFLKEPPEKLRNLLLPDFECLYGTGPWGYSLSQEITLPEGSFELHRVDAPGSVLFAAPTERQFALQYMFKGLVDAYVNEGEYIALGENSTYLMHLPEGKRQKALFKTGTIISMHFNFSLEYLRRRAAVFPLQHFLDAYTVQPSKVVTAGPVYIDHILKNLWKELLNKLRTHEHPARLLTVYGEQILSRYCELWEKQEKLKLVSAGHNTDSKYEKELMEVLERVESNFQTSYTIAKMAKDVGMNVAALKNEFKKKFGITIHQKRLELRMEYAKKLILTTAEPVKNIAIDSGYQNISHFNAMFKKKYGKSPTELRMK